MRVLRALWAEELVTFDGRWHHIADGGLRPLPTRRQIPLWMGGAQANRPDSPDLERALRRIGQHADGWVLTGRPGDEVARRVDRVREYARTAGRDLARIGLEGGIPYGGGDADTWRRDLSAWQAMGATHVTLQTHGAEPLGVREHIDRLTRMALELVPSP
jgi:alkanesulfonate monooxygenase SsuD/methylene tetrahydromethanopterin reductase-like flavin-dependent oxidoreductase (luciferase family)